jgi:acyl transferase domain-containing protein
MEDERASMLRALAGLHTQGHQVASDTVFTMPTQQVGLPTYPWQRERHWLDLATSAGVSEPSGPARGEHPLLGGRVRAARPLWEAGLGDERFGYLEDHLVQGVLVFPGAAYVEMALAAAQASNDSSEAAVVLRDVSFERALFIKNRAETLV